MIQGILPTASGGLEMTQCLTLYDWPGKVTSEWIVAFDEIFKRLGSSISEGTGSLFDNSTHGSYSRVRKRLENFLDRSSGCGEFDIRIRSSEQFLDIPFFPSAVEIVMNADKNRRNKICISIRDDLISDYINILDVVGDIIFELSGPCYGALFQFPAAFGPAFYLSSITSLPAGAAWSANQAYADRITRWRDRTTRHGLSPNDGFFRELYAVNIVSERHLTKNVGGVSIQQYAERVGELSNLKYCEDIYRWNIDLNNIDFCRDQMEDSGLILSSLSPVKNT